MALFRRGPVPAPPDPDLAAGSGPDADEDAGGDVVEPEIVGPDLPPSRMRGTEALYGYVVGLELLVVGILNATVTTGKGAPAHPSTGLAAAGIAAAVAFFGVIQTKNRTFVGLAAIVAAFFATLPKVPNSLGVAHIFALAIPLAYGLIITQRQRRAILDANKAGRRTRRGAGAGAGDRTRAATGGRARRGDRGRQPTVPAGPRPSARYTPPKSRRTKGSARGR